MAVLPFRSKHVKKQAVATATATGTKSKSGKVSFSTGTGTKLAKPETPIYSLAQQFQHYLHLPDPSALYALMGAVAANMLHGQDPVWIMVVGSSGSGKTTLLKSLRSIKGVHLIGDLDTKAAFLSGVKKKDQMAGSKGGLLNEIGNRGALVWYEFTAVLELPRDALKSILTALRQIYDGYYSRDVGTEGHRKLEWSGRLAAFAGVTNAIDQAYEFASKMGERFVFYRLPETDGWGESFKALQMEDREDIAEELAEIVENFFEGLGMSWVKGQETEARELKVWEKNRIIALGQFATKARSGVVRDYQQREIVDVPTSEAPMRFTKIFRRLYIGMEVIGVDDEDRWRVLRKIAMDSMPLVRRAIIEVMLRKVSESDSHDHRKGVGVTELSEVMRVSQTTVRRVLEDLGAHDVVEHAKSEDGGKGKGWRLTDWAWERIGST